MKKLVVMAIVAIMVVLSMTACGKSNAESNNETESKQMTLDEMIDYVDQNLDKSFKEDENFIFYSVGKNVNDNTMVVTQVEKVVNFENDSDRYLTVVIVYDANGEMIEAQSASTIDSDGSFVKKLNAYTDSFK